MKTRILNNTRARYRPECSWKIGKSPDLGDIHFRSSWERNYARYLNYLIKQGKIKKWDYEVQTFWFEKIKRGTVSFKPDFQVINNDDSIEYHEVKGWMDKQSLTKIKRMRIYHPKIKLIIITKIEYKELCKYGKLFSKFWEESSSV